MHTLARLFPSGESGENPAAIRAYHMMVSFRDNLSAFSRIFSKTHSDNQSWPSIPGSYRVGDPVSPVAVCTLTSDELIGATVAPGNVAISGGLKTPNLGIEKIILNCTANPNIRLLVLCGKESSVFYPGQALQALAESGIDRENRIKQAKGHFPVLRNISRQVINRFVDQIRIVNLMGELDPVRIQQKIEEILKQYAPEPYKGRKITESQGKETELNDEKFREIKPGGKRTPIDQDEKGFFVITTEPDSKTIIVKHYYNSNQPGHIIRGCSGHSILLALVRENLISEISHAGYLGAELMKAETSLRLNLRYEQDKPLQKK